MSIGSLLFGILCMLLATPWTPAADAPYRAFTADSYWNTTLPAEAPVDPASERIIKWLKSDNKSPHINLAGASSSGEWGQPIYWAKDGDPIFAVQPRPQSEFTFLRIPKNARPDPTSDSELTVYDLQRGYVAQFWSAKYDEATSTWSKGGKGVIHYLHSNGLDGSWTQFPGADSRNFGHRGVPAPIMCVRLDEIQAGVIAHVLKIAIHHTKAAHVFPMVGDENGTEAEDAPPEGTRIRIKPSVDLAKRDLSPAARVIATALQQYGAIISDQSGGSVTLKVENTVVEGRGDLWKGVLTPRSLASIPLDDYEVIQLGYGQKGPPSRPAEGNVKHNGEKK